MIKLNYISSTTSPLWERGDKIKLINTAWGRDVKLLQPGRRREEHPEKAEQVFCTDDCFSKYTFQLQKGFTRSTTLQVLRTQPQVHLQEQQPENMVRACTC